MLALFAERGGDPDRAGKRDPLDPLLWRGRASGRARPGTLRSDAAGPGWHVECAAIALEHLGAEIDIQGGGSDLAYPAPRVQRRACRGRLRPLAVRRQLRALGDARVTRARRCRSRSATWSSSRCCAATGSTRWPSGSRCCRTTTASDWEWTPRPSKTRIARLSRWRAATVRVSGRAGRRQRAHPHADLPGGRPRCADGAGRRRRLG